MEFKDRKKELSEIREVLESPKFEFLVIYGRRRIGKTELVLNATKNKKRLYYLAVGEKNLERFHNACIEFDAEASKLRQDFEVLFDFLKNRADAIIIDEFQEMIKENRNITGLFQSIVDTKLKDSKTKLILLGSSVSMITSKVLSYKSPLYGRRTASMKLKSVSFFDLKEFFPKAGMRELVEIFGFADGIPYYLVKINKSFWHWLLEETKKERGFLRDEVDFLLRYEFENPSTYKIILEAIANGKTKLNEIKNFAKIQRTDLSPYIRNLLETGLIRRDVPITENQKSRNGRYYLNDNFLVFWFRFVYPNQSSIESGVFDTTRIKKEYPAHLGKIFEEICKEFIVRKNIFSLTKIGKWWEKDKEIDIIGLDENTNTVLFAECKWKEKINAEKIAKELNQKTGFFNWRNRQRKEELAIFAKSFSKKITELEGKKVHCFELKDLQA